MNNPDHNVSFVCELHIGFKVGRATSIEVLKGGINAKIYFVIVN